MVFTATRILYEERSIVSNCWASHIAAAAAAAADDDDDDDDKNDNNDNNAG